jgi:putative serine protease PepD
MVHILAGGTSVGIGLVLTQSGKVLTPYQPTAGAVNLAAEYVFSHKTFTARLIGVDQDAGLALLQMEGSNGRPFSTVTVGNSDTIASSTAEVRGASARVSGEIIATAVSTTGTADGVTLDVGTMTSLNTNVDIDGSTWDGLMASTLPSPLPWVLGDPLVNPNGHVIGIIIGNARSGGGTVAYALPINGVLSVANRIADGRS